MKKVIKVINNELDRLFKHFRDLRADINHNTRSIDDLSGYLTEAQAHIGTLLVEKTTNIDLDERTDKMEKVLDQVCAGLADFEIEYYASRDDQDNRLDALNGIVTAIGKHNGEEARNAEYDADTRKIIFGMNMQMDSLQNRLESMEKYLVDHVDPQLAYGDSLDGVPDEVDLDKDIIGSGVTVTFEDGEVDVQSFDKDEEVFIGADDIISPTRRRQTMDAEEAARNVWLRLNPMSNTPEPHVNQFYTGPSVYGRVGEETVTENSYRYRLADAMSVGNAKRRDSLLGLFAPLSESELMLLMGHCQYAAAQPDTLMNIFINE